jgi:cytochrome o ubiquinol oxidase subunit II
VPVIVMTLGFAWWFRSSNPRARREAGLTYHGSIEFVVWSIPALVVILLGGVCWIGAHQLDPHAALASKAKPVDVEVVSLDWKWLFIYPEQKIAAVNELVVPADTPVSFHLTSATVMNSFFVPQLGSQIYTMPGMTTRLNLLAARPGEFTGFSAQFSGDGFAGMRFKVRAVPPNDFTAWVTKARGAGAALDLGAYAKLAKPSSAVPPTTYRAVDPDLFKRIVDQTALDPGNKSADGAWCPPAARAGG